MEQWHFERDYDACVSDTRIGFAAAAHELTLPASLTNMQLDFLNQLWNHMAEQRGGGPDYTGQHRYDPFSTGLRTLTTNLRHLDLRVMADETLFWLSSSETSWPNLELLNVVFYLRAPSGCWYFRGPAGEGETNVGYTVTDSMRPPLDDENDEDRRWHEERRNEDARGNSEIIIPTFRTVPNNHVITPFLTAFAKATSKMHALRAAVLWTPIENVAWGLAYTRPNESRPLETLSGMPYMPFRQIWWSVGDWRPQPSLHRLLRGTGATMHGERLQEYWDSEESKDGMLTATAFERSFAAFPRSNGPGPRDPLIQKWYPRTMV
jgi:hypothetical protein